MLRVPITGDAPGKPLAHGGDLEAARRRHPAAPEPWIDLSTGINPRSWPVPDLPAEAWTRLPSRDAEQALAAAAATRYRAAPAEIVAAPGTQALIQLLPRLVAPSRVAILGHTYAEHAHCWRQVGHAVSIVEHEADLAGADVAVVVNPDNPTGRLLSPDRLRALQAGLLVVDEAFIDLHPPEASLAAGLPEQAVVLRSFGKTYGLAGLRLGFAIAPPALAGRLREALGPWSVSGPALSIGRQALEDGAWLAATATRLAGDAARLDAVLMAAGFSVVGGTALFRLAGHRDAAALADRLGQCGIHVRVFEHRPHWIRFGIPGDAPAFDRLAAALQVPQKVWETRSSGLGGSA
ncbi:threonine-phosphate decarboxylase CobD [Reyranella sp.]|uniref:threonine-phosphate decarboxylase CobD n=1 Tax=Reyranella sp. TaxID=1929291 RepID=UPI003BAB8065